MDKLEVQNDQTTEALQEMVTWMDIEWPGRNSIVICKYILPKSKQFIVL